MHVLIGAGLDLSLVVLSNVTLRFFDGFDNYLISSWVKVVAGFIKKFLAIIVQRASSDVHLHYSISHGEAVANWRDISGIITRVDDNTCSFSSSIERHDRLESDVCILDPIVIK